MAQVYGNANSAAAHHVDTRKAIKHHTRMVEVKATVNLMATGHTPRITGVNDPADEYFPATVSAEFGDVDGYVVLHAPNAMALEFGHKPSGYFKDKKSRPPAPTYILTRAAYG